jgi:hypothetical protein
MIKHLKARILCLATIERSRAQQRSRLTWLKLDDANTKFFHLASNGRRKKKVICLLQTNDGVALTQQDKYAAIYDHFLQHLGTYVPHKCKLNFSNLGWQPRSLLHLDEPVSENELQSVIMEAPKEKAPCPGGFIGLFFSSCWDIIKGDLQAGVNQSMAMNQQSLHLLNQAYIVLIPKKICPEKVSDFRPISLIHYFAKLVSKIMANRLGPKLKYLISNSRTAFIKGRCLHDSFTYA